MKDYIKEAVPTDFLVGIIEKALDEFNKAEETKDEIIIRNACEKAWCATVQAINGLFVKKGITPLPKTHKQRRLKLLELEEKDEEIKRLCLHNRFAAKAYILHELIFYDGEVSQFEAKEEIKKVKKFIEDIRNL